MPVKLQVGLSQKIGLRDYGSLGASCQVEVELAHDVVVADIEAFHRHARHAFAACREAVAEELAHGAPASSNQRARTNCRSQAQCANPDTQVAHVVRASGKQLGYACRLANQIRSFGPRPMDEICDAMFGKPLSELSTLEASGLIDTLKDVKAGKLDLAAVLGEPAAHGAAA